MAQRRHVSLPKSSVSGQTPSPENLYYGEVAVNYFSGDEFLSIKNTSGNIVTFRTEQYYKEKELVVSSALNDLNDRTSALGDRVTTLENSAPDMSNYATTAVTNALRTDLNTVSGKVASAVTGVTGISGISASVPTGWPLLNTRMRQALKCLPRHMLHITTQRLRRPS